MPFDSADSAKLERIASALERIADALYVEKYDHPLSICCVLEGIAEALDSINSEGVYTLSPE